MPNASDHVTEIHTPFDRLVTVKKTSPFSELYYKMSTLGVRHCPVVDPKTRECSRIISRRDIVKLIPPGNTLITTEVQDATGITISPSILIDLIDELGDQKIEELFPDQELISVCQTDSIAKAIELLSIRHTLGSKNIYISGLPVMSNKKLLGFLSFTDVFKRFIREQETFLQTTVEHIATMASDKPLYTLYESQRLSDALMRMESLGVRSLPVVEKPKSDKLVGFVEDVQVMAYNHPAFAEELGTLEVKYFMTSLDRLYTPMPGELLGDCLHKFWEAPKGMYPPSTLVICNTKDGDDKRLRGVISCVDVLRKWREAQFQENDEVGEKI